MWHITLFSYPVCLFPVWIKLFRSVLLRASHRLFPAPNGISWSFSSGLLHKQIRAIHKHVTLVFPPAQPAHCPRRGFPCYPKWVSEWVSDWQSEWMMAGDQFMVQWQATFSLRVLVLCALLLRFVLFCFVLCVLTDWTPPDPHPQPPTRNHLPLCQRLFVCGFGTPPPKHPPDCLFLLLSCFLSGQSFNYVQHLGWQGGLCTRFGLGHRTITEFATQFGGKFSDKH